MGKNVNYNCPLVSLAHRELISSQKSKGVKIKHTKNFFPLVSYHRFR